VQVRNTHCCRVKSIFVSSFFRLFSDRQTRTYTRTDSTKINSLLHRFTSAPYNNEQTIANYYLCRYINCWLSAQRCHDTIIMLVVYYLLQCISSTGQIIRSVCLCFCQSVCESVTWKELNTLQITILHRSSPNLSPS